VVTQKEDGDAGEAILRVARERDADLVVIGAHGRNFVARQVVGSVAAKVVRFAPCDVLVVR
jgi:nucleotide-binding universal stress UspA family protein